MCQHYATPLSVEHRHHIDSVEHDNCVLCLVEDKGPMTQEAIASYFGVTKEWINQIERAALKKLQAAIDLEPDDLVFDSLPSFTPKTVQYQGRSNIASYVDVRSQFSTEDPILPYSWRHRCITK